MRVLGIDAGLRRTGVAISDDKGRMAVPLMTVESDAEALPGRIAELARDRDVSEIVVGLPKRLSGEDGPEASSARKLARRLEEMLHLPVHVLDERLTTVGAQSLFKQSGLKARNQKPVVDQMAATLLLQGFLDSRMREGKVE